MRYILTTPISPLVKGTPPKHMKAHWLKTFLWLALKPLAIVSASAVWVSSVCEDSGHAQWERAQVWWSNEIIDSVYCSLVVSDNFIYWWVSGCEKDLN